MAQATLSAPFVAITPRMRDYTETLWVLSLNTRALNFPRAVDDDKAGIAEAGEDVHGPLGPKPILLPLWVVVVGPDLRRPRKLGAAEAGDAVPLMRPRVATNVTKPGRNLCRDTMRFFR
jgi:hypothetical protein